MRNIEDVFYEIPTKAIIEFKQACKNMINQCSKVQTTRSNLIEFHGYTDEQLKIKDEKINPELYNSFKMFDKGVEIVWTNCFYDAETMTLVRQGNHYKYGIKYYNCRSNIFDKATPYDFENHVYGRWDTLDEAKSYFRRAVVDLLVQTGHCSALNPYDFM